VKCTCAPNARCGRCDEPPPPLPPVFGYDGEEGRSVVCLGCGERIRYMDCVRSLEEGYVHEGCEPEVEP